jgi:hypothetical protein
MKGLLSFFVQIALPACASASIGALITALLIHLWPGSTAQFSLLLWFSIFIFSFIGLFVIGVAVVGFFRPFVNSISSPLGLFWIAGVTGAILYFLVNLGIAAMLPARGAVASFFSSCAFLVPLVVGFIFGSLFGLFYHVICIPSGKPPQPTVAATLPTSFINTTSTATEKKHR